MNFGPLAGVFGRFGQGQAAPQQPTQKEPAEETSPPSVCYEDKFFILTGPADSDEPLKEIVFDIPRTRKSYMVRDDAPPSTAVYPEPTHR